MAAIVRQPFAPLDGTRLQSLNGIKNVQNSIPTSVSSPGKRKVADFFDANDFENVDPALLFSKRAKSSPNGPSKDFFQPPTFLLTKSTSVPTLADKDGLCSYSPSKLATSRPRSMLNPKSPGRKVGRSLSKISSPPKSAPAGRSPTSGNRRVGILNRKRAGRIDPPAFNLFTGGFSLDAAIKGTVPSYASHSSTNGKVTSAAADNFYDTGMKSSWFFDIHEDTPEQEMTNLLQHSTCMLDISSDEECEQKMRKEKAEGRGKENIPPADDMSQTSTRRSAAVTSEGGMEYEKPRVALGSLNAEDFYAEGLDPTEVIIVPGDDDDDDATVDGEVPCDVTKVPSVLPETDLAPEVVVKAAVEEAERPKTPVNLAAFQPLEGAGESFDLWESSSAKEEGDNAPSPVPRSPSSEHGDC